jgi:hypothetical protein
LDHFRFKALLESFSFSQCSKLTLSLFILVVVPSKVPVFTNGVWDGMIAGGRKKRERERRIVNKREKERKETDPRVMLDV